MARIVHSIWNQPPFDRTTASCVPLPAQTDSPKPLAVSISPTCQHALNFNRVPQAGAATAMRLTQLSICETLQRIGLFKAMDISNGDVLNMSFSGGEVETPEVFDILDDLDTPSELLADDRIAMMRPCEVSQDLEICHPEIEGSLMSILDEADKSIKVAPSEALAATVPDLMDRSAPLGIRMATQIDELRLPSHKKRRKKAETPASKKDAAYYARRAKNNKAASLNRKKLRDNRAAAKKTALKLSSTNAKLRCQVQTLEAELQELLSKKSALCHYAGHQLDMLDSSDFSLSPPDCLV